MKKSERHSTSDFEWVKYQIVKRNHMARTWGWPLRAESGPSQQSLRKWCPRPTTTEISSANNQRAQRKTEHQKPLLLQPHLDLHLLRQWAVDAARLTQTPAKETANRFTFEGLSLWSSVTQQKKMNTLNT